MAVALDAHVLVLLLVHKGSRHQDYYVVFGSTYNSLPPYVCRLNLAPILELSSLKTSMPAAVAVGAADVALGALAMGMTAAEGVARTFGLGRQPSASQGAQELGEEREAEDEEDAESDWEDEYSDSDWEDEEPLNHDEEEESPMDALMYATDHLAVALMDEQVRACPVTAPLPVTLIHANA